MGDARKKIGPAHLVLGAGGVRVISSVGALVDLEDAGVEWQSISACSAGTVLGALLAAGIEAKLLEKIIRTEDMTQLAGFPYQFGRIRQILLPPFARFASSGIPEFFLRMIHKYKQTQSQSSVDMKLEDL
jgi:predicted acylesterase/phospholipase RssA